MRFSDLYRQLPSDERAKLAAKLDSEVGYLYQLATRWRGKRPSLEFIMKLAEADSRLTVGELAEEFSEPATDKTAEA